ncbi:hypothetical protein ES703_117760 [subsurface metagenome]
MASEVTSFSWVRKIQREPVVFPSIGSGTKKFVEHMVLTGTMVGTIDANDNLTEVSAQFDLSDRGVIISAQIHFEGWGLVGDPMCQSFHGNIYLDGCSFFEYMESCYRDPVVGQGHYYAKSLLHPYLRVPFDDDSYVNMRLSSDNKQAAAVNVTCTVIIHMLKED